MLQEQEHQILAKRKNVIQTRVLSMGLLLAISLNVLFRWDLYSIALDQLSGLFSILFILLMVGLCYELATTLRLYLALRHDIAHADKVLEIGTIIKRYNNVDDASDGAPLVAKYHIATQFGPIEVPEKLYHKLAVGDMVQVTVGRRSRTLLYIHKLQTRDADQPADHKTN